MASSNQHSRADSPFYTRKGAVLKAPKGVTADRKNTVTRKGRKGRKK